VEAFRIGLVCGVMERQLRGAFELKWADDDLDARLTFAQNDPSRPAGHGAEHFRTG
jgi:hypothetical protein